jgi:hypothetical protein
MHTAALLLMFFAVLVACWGFSVLVRSISEWRFFRRYPKTTARKAGRWWSPLVGVVAIAASVYPCKLGLHWAEMDSGVVIGWLYAVAAGVGVFGLWLGISWAIGDRSRGRRRCTRCLYDMSGLPGLRCPECGREFRSEKHLFRAKRGRWACVVSLFLISASGFMFLRTAKVEEHGPLMLVPTPVLMAGWRWLPAPTIYSWDHDALDGSLEQRLDSIDELGWPARIRIADRLLTRMQRSEGNRWNRRLASLINACLDSVNPDELDPAIAGQIAALGKKHANLFDQVGVEVAIAATTRPKTDESTERLEFSTDWYAVSKHPYVLLQRLAYASETHAGPDTIAGRNKILRRLLPNTRDALTLRNALLVLREIPNGNDLLFEVMLDSGFISDYLQEVLSSQPFQSSSDLSRSTIRLASALATAPVESQTPMFDHMLKLVESSDAQQTAVVIVTSSLWARGQSFIGPMPEEFRATMLNSLVENALDDDRIPFSTFEHLSDMTIRSWAQSAIMNLDPNGSIAMPLLRDWVLNGDTSIYYDFWTKREPDLTTANWLNHLSDLATHPDRKIRLWLSESLPIATGTPHDELVDSVIAGMADDPDEEIASNARDALKVRERPSASP